MIDAVLKRQTLYAQCLIGALAALLFLCVNVPRFLSVGPGLIGLIGAIAFFPVFGRRPDFFAPGLIFPALLVAFAAASSAWAPDPGFALERAGKLAGLMLPGMLLAGACLNLPASLVQRCTPYIPITFCMAALLMAFEEFCNLPIYRMVRGIPADAYVNSFELNRGGVVLAGCFVPALFMALSLPRSKTRVVLIASVPMTALLALLPTQSQTAQLAFLTGALFLLFPARCRASWIALGLFISAGILGAPWIAGPLNAYLSGFVDTDSVLWDASIPHRLEIWDFVARQIRNAPFLGHGIEATRFLRFDQEMRFVGLHTILHPHNAVYQIWIEFGVMGALFLLALINGLIRKCWQLSPLARRFALAALMTGVSIAVTGYGLWQGWLLGLFFLMAAFSLLAAKTRT